MKIVEFLFTSLEIVFERFVVLNKHLPYLFVYISMSTRSNAHTYEYTEFSYIIRISNFIISPLLLLDFLFC